MAFTKLSTTQLEFLEQHLRGTGRSLSSRQAAATYGIKNLRARLSEMRMAGLRVRTSRNSTGRTTYSISRRDVFGDQFRIFVR